MRSNYFGQMTEMPQGKEKPSLHVMQRDIGC